MARCQFCDTVMFGGVRDANGRYCSNRCRDQATSRRDALNTAHAALAAAKHGGTDVHIKVEGNANDLEVFDDKLTIAPRGVLGLWAKGLKGTKTIPFSSITAIQYKKPGLTNGYVQFTILGGTEYRGGVFEASSDENTFMFGSTVQDVVLEVKDFIERRIREGRQPAPRQAVSVADEIRKLAELRQQGLLSDEEFSTAKRKLLGV